MRSTIAVTAAASLLASQTVAALNIKVQDQQSVKDAAKTIAKDLMSYYKGNTDSSQLGLLPKPPYYWWEAGAMFGTMVGYSGMTGDKQYDGDIAKAIYSQVSDTKDFMMMNQADNLGNDDQAFWGLTAMSAVEHNLPTPDGAPKDIWLTAASGCFDRLISRWNTSFCDGGIKWQFIEKNNGFNYKSSIANAATMQLGARLALSTGNQTYADKATMIYEWMTKIGFITDSFQVLDGAGDDPDHCTKIDLHEWSYNSASVLGATAALASFSNKVGKSSDVKTWEDRTTGIWKHAQGNFFRDGVLYEQPCEDVGTCNVDQKSFKAYLARWATFAGQLVPSIKSSVQQSLGSTASSFAQACTGNDGSACGMKWYDGKYSGETGVGEEMSALEVVLGLLDTPFPSSSDSKTSTSSSSSSSSASASATSSASASNSSVNSTSSASSSSAQTTDSSSTVVATPAVSVAAKANNETVASAASTVTYTNSAGSAIVTTIPASRKPTVGAAQFLQVTYTNSAGAVVVTSAAAEAKEVTYTNSAGAVIVTSVAAANAGENCGEVTSTVTATVTPTTQADSTMVKVSTTLATTAVATTKAIVPSGAAPSAGTGSWAGSHNVTSPSVSTSAAPPKNTIAQSNDAGSVRMSFGLVAVSAVLMMAYL